MNDPAVPFGERRRCAEYLLNYEKPHEVQVTLAAWERDLEGLVFDTDDVVDAEVLEDEPERLAIPPSDWEARAEVEDPADHPPRYGVGHYT